MYAKTALFSVAFPQNASFLKDFFVSIKQQTFTEIDLLMVNEGVDLNIFTKELPYNYTELVAPGDVLKNREYILQYICDQGYDNCFSLDTDDYCYPKRNQIIVDALNNCDLYVHDMELVDALGIRLRNDFIGSLKNNKALSFEDIAFRNFIGFGNMGIKVELLKKALPLPRDILAIDWWIASVVALHGAVIWYEPKPLNYYRQYDNNLAWLVITEKEHMLNQLCVIEAHYRNLINRFSHLIPNTLSLKDHLSIIQAIISSESLQNKLLVLCIENQTTYKRLLWWEYINVLVKENF